MSYEEDPFKIESTRVVTTFFIFADKKDNYNIKARMSLNFGKIPSLTSEFSALERMKNQ